MPRGARLMNEPSPPFSQAHGDQRGATLHTSRCHPAASSCAEQVYGPDAIPSRRSVHGSIPGHRVTGCSMQLEEGTRRGCLVCLQVPGREGGSVHVHHSHLQLDP